MPEEKNKKDYTFLKSLGSYSAILLVAIALGILFVFVSSIILEKYKIGFSDESYILGFVGVLATFVVISNYIQVQQVKQESEKKINELEGNISEVKVIKSELSELKRELEMHQNYLDARIYHLQGNDFINKKEYRNAYDILLTSLHYYVLCGNEYVMDINMLINYLMSNENMKKVSIEEIDKMISTEAKEKHVDMLVRELKECKTWDMKCLAEMYGKHIQKLRDKRNKQLNNQN